VIDKGARLPSKNVVCFKDRQRIPDVGWRRMVIAP